jgi:putative ABC transport system permease protein
MTQWMIFATLLVVALLAWRGARTPYRMQIGLRNALRYPTRTIIIVVGLMLATTLVAAALTINSTLISAVKTVAVYSIGRVDEEITGGSGSLGAFNQITGENLRTQFASDRQVAGVLPSLTIDGMLLVDETQQQAHGSITTLGLASENAGPLSVLQAGRQTFTIGDLAPNEIFLNQGAASDLRAHAGDLISLYSPYWSGQRIQAHVRAIIDTGPLGKRPSLLLPLDRLQTYANASKKINRIYIANTGDGLTGTDYSKAIAGRARTLLGKGFRVRTVKASAIAFALQAQALFERILTVFTLFALAIDLLLIFLIFTLLAAERRVDLGTERALGFHRFHIIETMLIEGAIYDLAAAIPGALLGIGLGIGIILLINPTVATLGFPLQPQIASSDIILALCLGFLVTIVTVALAAWNISRAPIAAALRGLPDPPTSPPTAESLVTAAVIAVQKHSARAIFDAAQAFIWNGLWSGIIPLVAGLITLFSANRSKNSTFFALGGAAAVAGFVLFIRWQVVRMIIARRRVSERLGIFDIQEIEQSSYRWSALAIGGAWILYWALPFDLLGRILTPRFSGSIDVFFVGGMLMIAGAIIALTPNIDLLLSPIQWLLLRGRSYRRGIVEHAVYLGLRYPSTQRARTGISLALFSLVCFTMVITACIAASTSRHYQNVPELTGGYDIIGQPLFSPCPSMDDCIHTIQKNSPETARQLAAVSAATPLPLGIIQPGDTSARWGLYPMSSIEGAFLQGTGLPLAARASGYETDADVWNAVREHPDYVVIDAGALSQEDANTLGIDVPQSPQLEQFAAPPIASTLLGPETLESALSRPDVQSLLNSTPAEVRELLQDPNKLRTYTFHLSHVVDKKTSHFQPTPVWLADFRGNPAEQVTIIGIVDNTQGQRYGVMGSPATFAPLEQSLPSVGNSYYYFQLTRGANVQDVAHALSASLLGLGFETTVIRTALLDLNAPRVFASEVLLRMVGMLLVVGTAALMMTSLRSVVERRQQIGMLRALGLHRRHIQIMFIIETLWVAISGALIGLVLGIILSRNAFGMTFFDATTAHLALTIPWLTLVGICAIAVLAATLAVTAPAWQANSITPAEALRYE